MIKPLEEKPVKEILVTMSSMSYLFALTALAATIAWIYYTAKAVDAQQIGGPDGSPVGADATSVLSTTNTMFEGVVLSVLLYMVFRHHFSNTHM